MKSIVLALLVSATLVIASFSLAQTPDSGRDERILALIKEVQTQQAQIVDNQAKIETKLADVAETIRLARIHAAQSR
jgi:septal ring factor EnvC (AmiA/AmiB activator)